jgi:membrane-associated phospholipid phosphatase
MIKIFQQNKWFFLPYLVFILLGAILLFSFSKEETHIYLNQFNNIALDCFFKIFTHLGDGIMLAITIPFLLFVKYRYAIVLSISSLLITIEVQSFKRYFLPDFDRPILVLKNFKGLHIVEGVQMHITHSFPSGHSATGFGVFLMMAMIVQNKYLKLLFFIIAFLIGYSRIYLSQHFLMDVYFGSIMALATTSIVYLWVENWKIPKLELSLRNLNSKKNAKIA